MPAINYCIYKTNIWCIPTTEIATWWQVVIAAVAVVFAIRAIKATNETSKAVLDRDQRILDAKRAPFLVPLRNEIHAILVRTYQMKNLVEGDNSQEAFEHTFSILRLMEMPCAERSIGIIEAFKEDEAQNLTDCSVVIARAHNFVAGNSSNDLADPVQRKLLYPSIASLLGNLERIFSKSYQTFSGATGKPADLSSVKAYADNEPILLTRAQVEARS